MTKHFLYKNIFKAIFLFASLFGNAQDKTIVKVSVDKNKILIGERFNLTFEATIPSKQIFQFPSLDNIPHFEIISNKKIDSTETENALILKQRIQLTSFDSGHWYIPAFYFGKKIRTDSIPIDVVFSDFDPQKSYHDVKDIIEVSPEKEKQWWWYAIIGSVVAIGIAVWLLARKKKPRVIETKPIDPFKEAIIQLDKLERQNTPSQQFYTELVNIFRLYIFRKKGIQSLQKTTDDLIIQLGNININKEQFEKLSEALRLSDAVKFAKYQPTQEENRVVFKNIKDSIQTIEQMK